MRLGEKTTVLTFQRNPLRRKDLSTVYCIVMNLRTCPFDSHMYSIVNYKCSIL